MKIPLPCFIVYNVYGLRFPLCNTMYPNVCNMPLLKMLGLYLYTLIIGHKSCKMLSTSILNKLTLQKELQNCVINNVFLDK